MSANSNDISFQFELLAEDQFAACLYATTKSFWMVANWKRKRWHAIILVSVFWSLAGASILYGYSVGQIKGLATVLLLEGVVGIWAISISLWTIHFKKMMLRNVGFYGTPPVTLRSQVGRDGWTQFTDHSTLNLTWSAFAEVVETADHLLAYRVGAGCLVAPKSALSSPEFERLKTLLKSKVSHYRVLV